MIFFFDCSLYLWQSETRFLKKNNVRPGFRLNNSIDITKQIHYIHKPSSTNIEKHPRRNQNQFSATAIAIDNTVTDENRTLVSTDTAPEINFLKQLED